MGDPSAPARARDATPAVAGAPFGPTLIVATAQESMTLSDSESASEYADAAREPGLWLSQAKTLHRAAALVHDDLHEAIRDRRLARDTRQVKLLLMGPFMLLSGLAIENVLKAVIVQRDPSIVSDTGISKGAWPGGKDGHALEEMAINVTGSLSNEERELTHRLEDFVRWGGRYPVPLKAAQRLSQRFKPSDRDAIDNLFARLVAIMESEKGDT